MTLRRTSPAAEPDVDPESPQVAIGAAPPLADVADRRPQRRRPRWYLEALVIVWLAWIYDIISNLPAVRAAAAVSHGLQLLHFEQRLHIAPELALNHWLYHHPLLGLIAGDYYDNAHFVVTFAVIGWLWWRHPREYRPLRTGLILITVIGFVVYWQYPMAPLRLLPGVGSYDIVAITHAYGGWHAGPLKHVANQYASMPSLHMAWAVWSAYAVWYVFRRRVWAHLAWIYPVLTLYDVLATANHLVLDCVAGVATMVVATAAGFVLTARWDRYRDRASPLLAVAGGASAPPRQS